MPNVLNRPVAQAPKVATGVVNARPAAVAPPKTVFRPQVLQTGRAPAQLSLFLRPSAVDVK